MNKLYLGGPCAAHTFELGTSDFAQLGASHQVADVSVIAPGREGSAIRFEALHELAQPSRDARFVHVASADGSFTANLPIETILAQGIVLYSLAGDALPPRYGGPFRLLLIDEKDCSVNVKFLARVEYVREPGSHTAQCADGK